MDFLLLYTLVKYIHILGAIAWIGGGVTLCVLGLLAAARNDDGEVLHILESTGVLANRWFVPASLVTLICGIAMAFLGSLWGEGWLVLGLVGFAATFVTGHFALRPRAMRIVALAQAGELPKAGTEARRMLQIAKFDYTMLFMVVAVMVLRPQWTDFAVLGVIGAILAAAALVFLVPLFGRTPAEPSSA